MKQHPRLWVYNYNFEFELANELKYYQDRSGFHPWYFLNRSWHVMLPLATASDGMLVYEKPHPQLIGYLERKLGGLPDFLVLRPKRESNAIFGDLTPAESNFHPPGSRRLSPWGWSCKAIAFGKHIDSPGIENVDLKTIRWVNSKKTSHSLRQELLPESLQIPGLIIEDADLNEAALSKIVTRFMQQYGRIFVKHPYGSAGRLSDLCVTPHFSDRKIRKWKNWIRAAGGIVLEKTLPIEQEWSIQVQIADNRSLHPLALTRLFSNPNGNYLGTIIMDTDQQRLDSLVGSLKPVLDAILATDYQGPLGIDLIETTAGEFKLLEINGRLTMGRVAFEWHRRIAGLPVSFFTNLFFKTGQISDIEAVIDHIRKTEQLFGCPVTLLNFVLDGTQKGLMISLLIEGIDLTNIQATLGALKKQLKADMMERPNNS